MLPRTRAWVESWHAVKERPEAEVQKYILGKCRNGFQVAKKASRGQRDAWVTLLAEPDRTKDQLSTLAMSVVEYVRAKLEEDGYDFELNLDETGGVAYAEVHFKTLERRPKNQGADLKPARSHQRQG
jgi:hypothetical protein